MNCDLITERVRHQVRNALRLQGASPEAPLVESFLIRNGCFCGRRFEIDGWSAVWFEEEKELKLYDRGGRLQQVLDRKVSPASEAA